jgi:hypothetical protein
MSSPKQIEWREYRQTLTPGTVEVGLERVREARRLLRRHVVVEERLLDRRFRLRDELAWGRYESILGQAAEHMSHGTFGAYVDIDAVPNGVRVRLVRRALGERELEVAISDERRFDAHEVSASAEYAEQLRAVARGENDAFWAGAREAAERARSAREDARQRAREAAELGEILESEDSAEGP